MSVYLCGCLSSGHWVRFRMRASCAKSYLFLWMALYILTGCSGPKSSGADSPFVVSTNSKGTSSSTDDAVHRRVEELGTCREPEPKTAASLNHRSRQN